MYINMRKHVLEFKAIFMIILFKVPEKNTKRFFNHNRVFKDFDNMSITINFL